MLFPCIFLSSRHSFALFLKFYLFISDVLVNSEMRALHCLCLKNYLVNSKLYQDGHDNNPPRPPETTDQAERGLAIIMYLRFCDRAGNLQSFRNAFKQSRKDRRTPQEAYEAAALMEYHCTKAK